MATTLTFDAVEVAAQARHALDADTHRALFDQPSPAAGLWLVHDQGVYLMSNGAGPVEDRPRPAYAAGCDPDRDPDWWDTGRDLVGGDDFAEMAADGANVVSIAGLGEGDEFTVEVHESHITVTYTAGAGE